MSNSYIRLASLILLLFLAPACRQEARPPASAPSLPKFHGPSGDPPIPEPASAISSVVEMFYEELSTMYATGEPSEFFKYLVTSDCKPCMSYVDEVRRLGRASTLAAPVRADPLGEARVDVARTSATLRVRIMISGQVSFADLPSLAQLWGMSGAIRAITLTGDLTGVWRVASVEPG